MNISSLILQIFSVLFLLSALSCTTSQERSRGGTTLSAEAEKSENGVPAWAVPYYFVDSPLSVEGLIASPPNDGSPEDRRDFEALLRAQKSRSATQCESASSQVVPSLDSVFISPSKRRRDLPDFGKLSKKSMDALHEVFGRIQRDAASVGLKAKLKFARKRPYDRWNEIEPCIARETSGAYPSGHSWFAAIGAEFLSDLFPTKKRAIQVLADQAAEHRLVGGVHHPSDIVAGKELGRKIYSLLKKNPRFQEDLRRVRSSIMEDEKRKVRAKFAPGSSLEKVPGGGSGL